MNCLVCFISNLHYWVLFFFVKTDEEDRYKNALTKMDATLLMYFFRSRYKLK